MEQKKVEPVSLEEALEITGVGRFTVMMLVFCGSLMLGMILETLGFGYVLPGVQCDLRIQHDLYTWLASVPFVGFIVTSHAWGWAADRWGRRRALMLSMSVGSVLSLLSSLSPNLPVFVTLRLGASLFIAGGAALGYAFLGEMCAPSNRDAVIMLGNAALASGTGIVPLLAWAVLPLDFSLPFWAGVYRPWRLLIKLFALPYLVCSIVCLWLPESPKFLSSVGKDEEALGVLATMYSVNTGRGRQEYPVDSLKSEMEEGAMSRSALRALWEQSLGIFKPPLLKYTLLLSFMQFVVFGISNGYYIWLPEVVTKVMSAADRPLPSSGTFNSSEPRDFCGLLAGVTTDTPEHSEALCNDTLRTEAFTVAIYLSIAVTSLTVASAFTSRYLGKRNLILIFLCIVAASCATLLLVTDPIMATVAFAGLQLGGSIIGIVSAFAVQVYPTSMRAMGVCMTMMFGRVGSLVATKVIGVLLALSCPTAFVATLLFLAVMFAATFTLPKDKVRSCRSSHSSDTTSRCQS